MGETITIYSSETSDGIPIEVKVYSPDTLENLINPSECYVMVGDEREDFGFDTPENRRDAISYAQSLE